MNWQEIDIYVAMHDGLFLYNAKGNRLEPLLAKDVRAATGTQPFVATGGHLLLGHWTEASTEVVAFLRGVR